MGSRGAKQRKRDETNLAKGVVDYHLPVRVWDAGKQVPDGCVCLRIDVGLLAWNRLGFSVWLGGQGSVVEPNQCLGFLYNGLKDMVAGAAYMQSQALDSGVVVQILRSWVRLHRDSGGRPGVESIPRR